MNIYLFSPELALAALALVVIVLDLLTDDKDFVAVIAVAGLIVPAFLTLTLIGQNDTAFYGTLIVDSFSIVFKFLFLIIAAIIILSSMDFIKSRTKYHGEYYALVLLATMGMMLMASTGELISIYIGLELASLSLYVLSGFLKDAKGSEASLKYLLLGAISSAVLLYGMALIFGLTGTTMLDGISNQIRAGATEPALILGIIFIVAGLGFKIAAVPFQMWAPDVYEGAPTPVTAFLSVGSKAAGFALLLRVFQTAFGVAPVEWTTLFAVLSALSMTVGNVVALVQNNIKRMMGYSSIAQAGYVLVGVAALRLPEFGAASNVPLLGASGVVFFLISYTLTNLGAFAVIIAITNKVHSDNIDDFAGMAKRSPLLALALTICMISLVGVPPTAGFVAKFYLFNAAVENGLVWLVLIGVVNSVISAYYYIRVVKVMYFGTAASEERVQTSGLLATALGAALIGVVFLGIYPSPLFEVAQAASRNLFP